MTRYLLRRLLALGPTLIGVSLLSFLFLRLVPGDAIAVRLGTSTLLTPQQLAEHRAYLGLDRTLPHHGAPLAEAFHTPGREIQRHLATKEPTAEQLEVGIAALAEILRAEGA